MTTQVPTRKRRKSGRVRRKSFRKANGSSQSGIDLGGIITLQNMTTAGNGDANAAAKPESKKQSKYPYQIHGKNIGRVKIVKAKENMSTIWKDFSSHKNKHAAIPRQLLNEDDIITAKQLRENKEENLLFVFEQDDPDEVAQYNLAGNPDFHKDEMAHKRKQLKNDPDVKAEIEKFWELVYDGRGNETIPKYIYIELHHCICKALRPDYEEMNTRPPDAGSDYVSPLRRLAEWDWAHDMILKPPPDSDKELLKLMKDDHDYEMNKDRFEKAIFEVADMWTHEVDAAEYTAFLRKLLIRVTQLSSRTSMAKMVQAKAFTQMLHHSDDAWSKTRTENVKRGKLQAGFGTKAKARKYWNQIRTVVNLSSAIKHNAEEKKNLGKDGVPAVFVKPWVELTEAEKEAALVFGYSKSSWDNDSGHQAQPNLTNRTWDELTAKKRNALKALGLNKTSWNGRWRGNKLGKGAGKDSDGYDPHEQLEHWRDDRGGASMPTALFKPWVELTEAEKEAALVFGYTKVSWENDSGHEVQPNSVNRPWDELAIKKRNALKALGLNRASWNGRWRGHGRNRHNSSSRKPSTMFKDWDELSESEREAAESFGYNKLTWDNKSGDEVQPDSISRTWDELTTKKRNALKALGLTRASWNGRWRGHGRNGSRFGDGNGPDDDFWKLEYRVMKQRAVKSVGKCNYCGHIGTDMHFCPRLPMSAKDISFARFQNDTSGSEVYKTPDRRKLYRGRPSTAMSRRSKSPMRGRLRSSKRPASAPVHRRPKTSSDPQAKGPSKTGWSQEVAAKDRSPLSMVGMSLDPGKNSYQGLVRGDLVQLPDQSGVLRECSIYAINRTNDKWTFDLYVAAFDQLIQGVDVGIVRHMGGPDAPFVKDLSKAPQTTQAARPRPSSATTTRRTTRVRKPRPKSAKARSSSSQSTTGGETMRRTWGIDERFIPGTDAYKKRSKQALKRQMRRRSSSGGLAPRSRFSMRPIREEPETPQLSSPGLSSFTKFAEVPVFKRIVYKGASASSSSTT